MLSVLLFLCIVCVLTFVRPGYGLALVVNAFLVNAVFGFESGPLFAAVGVGGPLLGLATILFKHIFFERILYIHLTPNLIAILALFWLALLSNFYAKDSMAAIIVALRFFMFCVTYYCIALFLVAKQGEAIVRDLLFGHYGISLVFAVYALMFGQSSSEYVMRLTVGSVSAIPLSLLFGQGFVINFFYMLTTRRLSRLVGLLLSLAFLGYMLLLTNTRSTMIAVTGCMILMGLFGSKTLQFRGYLRLGVMFALSIFGVLAVLTYYSDMVERLVEGITRLVDGDFGESEGDRVIAWGYAWYLFTRSPVFGIGAGNFQEGYIAYVHNLPLEILAELGLVGAILLSIALFWGTFGSFDRSRRESLIVFALMAFYLVVAQVSMTLWMHKGLFLWLAVLHGRASRREPKVAIAQYHTQGGATTNGPLATAALLNTLEPRTSINFKKRSGTSPALIQPSAVQNTRARLMSALRKVLARKKHQRLEKRQRLKRLLQQREVILKAVNIAQAEPGDTMISLTPKSDAALAAKQERLAELLRRRQVLKTRLVLKREKQLQGEKTS